MSLGDSVRQVSEHANALARLELLLARRELARRAGRLGRAAALAATAVLLALFGLGFALAAAAAGIAEALPTWLAILVVAGGLLLVAAVLGAAAAAAFRRGSPPVPREAIAEAKATVRRLREAGANGRETEGNGHGA